MNTEVQIISDTQTFANVFTVCELDVRCPQDGFVVTAFARRNPEDKADPVLGAELAMARALSKAAKILESRVNGRIKNYEAQQRAIAAKKATAVPVAPKKRAARAKK